MRLFNYYDSILYTLTDVQRQILVRNIMKKVNIRQAVKSEREAFMEYKVRDTDRPEIIAHKVYGSVDYHWVILLMNDIYNPYYDWVLSQEEVEKLTDKRYGVGNRYQTHHYVDANNEPVVDEGNLLTLNVEKFPVSNLQYELECNESKRVIKILDPDYLQLVTNEIKTLLR